MFNENQNLTATVLRSETSMKGLLTNVYDNRLFVGIPKRVTRVTDETSEPLFTDSNVSNPTKVKGSVPRYMFEMENLPISYVDYLRSLDNKDVEVAIITSKNYVVGRGYFGGDLVTFPAKIYADRHNCKFLIWTEKELLIE